MRLLNGGSHTPDWQNSGPLPELADWPGFEHGCPAVAINVGMNVFAVMLPFWSAANGVHVEPFQVNAKPKEVTIRVSPTELPVVGKLAQLATGSFQYPVVACTITVGGWVTAAWFGLTTAAVGFATTFTGLPLASVSVTLPSFLATFDATPCHHASFACPHATPDSTMSTIPRILRTTNLQ
ncbi:hypothetical protein [Burkholderia sp. LMG 13014]|uniref:hypothetical protein n=1 Tax=Burkholderia sp. LMG 13014 TaxID=2709306 RepID=UPI0019653673|nr:hypothetical protein [Burkholderia sp. LMG 13014]